MFSSPKSAALAFIALSLSAASPSPAEKAPRPPNILFIAVDDLRPELGCYGASHVLTPNIDRLAARGVLFEKAYCQQALCGPSRASILTGLRPDATQIHGNHTHFRKHHPNIVTLPQHFKNHRYHTQSMGKIYHGVFPEGSSKTAPDTFGDPESWSVPTFRPGPRYYYTEEGIAQAKAAYLQSYKPKDPAPDDWTKKLVFGPMTEAPDVADDILYDGQIANRASETLVTLTKPDAPPFFLAVGFIKPHSPFIAPKKYWELYDPEKISLAQNPSPPKGAPAIALHNSNEIRRYTDQPKSGPFTPENQRHLRHGYYACVSYIDAQIGRVLDALEKSGAAENTIVVLWGDHGYHLGEKNIWGKTTNFELDARVPLIISVPGNPENGKTCPHPVELVDLYPTLSSLTNLPIPNHLQGSSLVPLIENPTVPTPTRTAFTQSSKSGHRGYSVTNGTFRYTEWIDLKTNSVAARELYDHRSDPDETTNIATDKSSADFVTKMSTLLDRGEGWRALRAQNASPELTLAKHFGNHMVLQRGEPIPISGTATPGSSITVTFANWIAPTTASADGTWSVTLPSQNAHSKGRELQISSGSKTITLQDVVVGDVWICAGQSNMRWMLNQSALADSEIKNASLPNLRLFDQSGSIYPNAKTYSLTELRDTGVENYYRPTGWLPSTPESAATFSAVAYHFGKKLHSELNVPIGLVHNAVGGVPMQSYIPVEPGNWLDPNRIPSWCAERARLNLKNWLADPVPPIPHHPFEPGFLFEAGIRPWTNFPICGFIWYQGESDATESGAGSPAIDPQKNLELHKSLITSWRSAWDDAKLPFYFVQLPGLNRNWPPFREVQLEIERSAPHTGMAVTIDLGHPTNVHPTHKKPVGERLARIALAKTYGTNNPLASGPRFESSKIAKGIAVIRFSGAQGGLKTTDANPAKFFTLAGENQKFHPAETRIDGESIIVHSKDVPHPVAIRYAWANDPNCNLVNLAGIPAAPFRTDSWPLPGVPIQHQRMLYTTGFENLPAGVFEKVTLGSAVWTAPANSAGITSRFAHNGTQSLHIFGGKNRSVIVTFEKPLPDGARVSFRAERWTKRAPFQFRISYSDKGSWHEFYNGDAGIKVGARFLTEVSALLPKATSQLQFSVTAPATAGALIDDLKVRTSGSEDGSSDP